MNDEHYKSIKQWQVEHDKADTERFSHVPTKQDIREIVSEVLHEELSGVSNGVYAWVKILAVIIGSLTVIFGGFKIFLGWIGYTKL